MKFFIEFNDYSNWQKREISEAVYTTIATATSEHANEIVYNVLGGKPFKNEWSLICE